MITPTSAPPLQRFFTQRLMQQRQASPHTISSYRDTFRQFLKFIQQRLRKPPSRLTFKEIDAPFIVAFLDELEKRQGLSVRGRNLRLTAIHLLLSIRGLRNACLLCTDPARARHPQQTLHPHLDPVPYSSRIRCFACCSESTHVVLSARSCISARGGADGTALI
jgi:site-specific recombinase XerC